MIIIAYLDSLRDMLTGIQAGGDYSTATPIALAGRFPANRRTKAEVEKSPYENRHKYCSFDPSRR